MVAGFRPFDLKRKNPEHSGVRRRPTLRRCGNVAARWPMPASCFSHRQTIIMLGGFLQILRRCGHFFRHGPTISSDLVILLIFEPRWQPGRY